LLHSSVWRRPSDDWQPTPLDSKLSVRQWLSLPGKLKQHSSSRWDVHTLYLPRLVLERLKAATIAGARGMGAAMQRGLHWHLQQQQHQTCRPASMNVKHCSCLPARPTNPLRLPAAAGGGFRVSTSDATQALLCTLVNDLRGRSLVPTSSDMITVNAGGWAGRGQSRPPEWWAACRRAAGWAWLAECIACGLMCSLLQRREPVLLPCGGP
jgi:hypothetical protein